MSSQHKADVLIVDDVAAVRESLASALAEAGYGVASAESGEAALAMLDRQDFAVVVTDIWMAEIDGLKLIKRLREGQAPVRIIAMTGGGPRLTIETASSLAEVWGAEKVFVKPFDEDELIALVDALTAGA